MPNPKISKIYIKKIAIYIFIAVFFVSLDRLLKILSLKIDSSKNLIGDLLQFNFIPNYYIAFSIPFTGILLNILIISILLFLIYYLITKIKELNLYDSSCLIFIILGTTSNLFDRLKYGYVIDYIDLKYFTIFNIADAMIVCGVFCLIILTMKEKNK